MNDPTRDAYEDLMRAINRLPRTQPGHRTRITSQVEDVEEAASRLAELLRDKNWAGPLMKSSSQPPTLDPCPLIGYLEMNSLRSGRVVAQCRRRWT
jgi:hypothetical protein